MILHTEKYTESDKRIQNNILLYKIHHKRQNTFEHIVFIIFENFENKNKITNSKNETVNISQRIPFFILLYL